MSKGGGGTNTVTQQSQPPPQFMAAYQNAVNQATQVAGQPLQQYQGQTVAPLSQAQNEGIGSIEGLSGAASPYIGAAQTDINASTSPLLPTVQPYLNSAQNLFNSAAGGYAGATQTDFGTYVNPALSQTNGTFANAGNGITFNPVGASQISQYESPYTQQVVNATQNQFNNQNAQQQSSVAGNAISQGAFGGDRSAVAAGITAGQQQLAQAPVIAGLENQGYSQALGEANTQQAAQLQEQEAKQSAQLQGAQGILAGGQLGLSADQAMAQTQLQAAQGTASAGTGLAGLGSTALGANEANAWLDSQAGFGEANLGNEAYSQQLQQANALLGAGSLQQGVNQANLNVPYQNFIAQQAYPFQTTQYLANISEGLGGASGGSSSTTSPGPSVGSQIAGTGLAGAGILGLTGAFGSSGWLGPAVSGAASFFGLNRGGGIGQRRAPGGPIDGPPDLSISIVPGAQGNPGRGMGPPRAPAAAGSHDTDPLKMLGTINSLKGLSQGFNKAGGPDLPVPPIPPEGAEGGGFGLSEGGGDGAEGGDGLASGGIVRFPSHLARMPGTGNRGITANSNMPTVPQAGGIRKLAAGGGADDFSDDDVPPPAIPSMDDGLPPLANNVGITGGPPTDSGGGLPVPPIPPDQAPPPADTEGSMPLGGITSASRRGNAAPDDEGASGGSSPWQTLLAAGLGIMGGTSPHAAVNIGRGGLEGLQFGEQQRARMENAALRRLQAQELSSYRQGQLANTADRNATYHDRVMEQTGKDQAQAAYMTAKAAMAGASHATEGDILASAVGSLANGKTVNPDTGQPWTRADALMHVKGVDSLVQRRQAQTDQGAQRIDLADQRAQQGDTRLDQGQQRIDQGSARLDQSQEMSNARNALVQRGQDMGSANNDVRTAGSMVASGAAPSITAALAQIAAARAQQTRQPAAAPVAMAAPSSGGGRPPLSSIFGE